MVGTSRVEVHHAMISPLPETEVTLERQEVDGAGRAGRGCQGELWFAPFFCYFYIVDCHPCSPVPVLSGFSFHHPTSHCLSTL